MHSIRERFLDLRGLAARAASLCRIPRIYRDYPDSSFFRFLSEDVEEGSPTRVVRRLRKSSTSDALDVQGFVGDESVSVHQLPSLLVVEVPTLVRCLFVKSSNLLTSLAAAVRTFLLPGDGTLRYPELLLCLPGVARRFHGLATRRNEEALEAEINADGRTVSGGLRCWGTPEIAREDHVPLATTTFDGDGLDFAFDRAMQLDLDMSDVLEIQSSVVFEAASVSVGRELDGPEPIFGLVSWITGRVPGLHAAEESLERLVQTAERSLSGREVRRYEARDNLAGLLEPPRLLAVGDGTPFGFVDVPAFSEGDVVQAAVRFEHHVKSLYLRAVWIKAVLERLPHTGIVLPENSALNHEKVGVRGFPRQLKQTVPAA